MPKGAANVLLRKEWYKFIVKLPVKVASRFQRELIEAQCHAVRALMSFCYAVAVGDIVVERNGTAEQGTQMHYRYDESGKFDSDRCYLKGKDGRILNPTPFNDNFLN